ncbi:MAG: PA domain-containing protein [Candidatus Krumholzibacteriia bacterium]
MRNHFRVSGRGAVAAALLLGLALSAAAVSAATITILNVDAAGEGFNDPTPASPVGGNTGTTVGQQRLIVFQTAANIWGAILPGTVQIRVQSAFDPLTCTATSAVLGSAGPVTVFRDFAGAEYPGAWYHVALANQRAGADLDAAGNDINARFNSNLGQSTCLAGSGWYYGLDGNEGALIDLLAVVLHELGHGLGFSTTTNGATGAYLSNYPSVFDLYLLDRTTGLHWSEMSATQRAASAINTGNLVWDGPAVRQRALQTLDPRPVLTVSSPAAIAGTYRVGTAGFGAALSNPGVTGAVVEANDGVGTTSDACTALVNGAAVAGNIALIDRGTCTFTAKALIAQNAGAIGVIIVNNSASSTPPSLGGSDPTIVIPVVSVTQADGTLIRAQLPSGVQATLALDPALLAGADEWGHPLMYTPNPYEAGSSVSHWDVSATPNLLMEPAINADLTHDVDLTRDAFEDIGWFAHVTAARPDPQSGVMTATLGRNSPNPFGGATTIRFALPAAGAVDLAVYDLAGRLVRRLAGGEQSAGEHFVTWKGDDAGGRRVAAGVYFYRLTANGRTATKTMVLFE